MSNEVESWLCLWVILVWNDSSSVFALFLCLVFCVSVYVLFCLLGYLYFFSYWLLVVLHIVKTLILFKNILILFFTTLGLGCCAQAFSSLGDQGPLSSCRLFIAVTSLVAECRLWGTQASGAVGCGVSRCGLWDPEHRLISCGTPAQLPRGMRGRPGPGIELVSLALLGRFLIPGPPGKPWH